MFKLKEDWEKEAIVDTEIRPHYPGRVRFRGSCWPARCSQNMTLTPGQICYVVGMSNITLIVEPLIFNNQRV